MGDAFRMALRKQFEREARLIGEENVRRLMDSTVAVAGLGAVGGHALEVIARAGVGRIITVDCDRVSESNLNRQILALHSTIGMLKTDAAEHRIKDINPDCVVTKCPAVISKDNVAEIFSEADCIIDCIDSVTAKTDLLEFAWKNNIKAVSSMGAALRRDVSFIHVSDVMDSYGCPLAKAIRSGLKKRGVGRGISCIFSDEKVSFSFIPPEEDENAEAVAGGTMKRAVLGSLPTVTAAFGIYAAQIALKMLLPEDVLSAISVR